MFILDEGLPLIWDIFWIIICIPLLYLSYKKVSKMYDPKHMELIIFSSIAMLVIIALFIKYDNPLLTGNSLPTILVGYPTTSILAVFLLLFIRIFVGMGGFLSIGANVFAVGIAGPYLGYQTYKILKRYHVHQIITTSLAVTVTEMSTILTSCLQLAIAYHYPTFTESLMSYINMYIINYPIDIIMVLILEILICNIILIKTQKN